MRAVEFGEDAADAVVWYHAGGGVEWYAQGREFGEGCGLVPDGFENVPCVEGDGFGLGGEAGGGFLVVVFPVVVCFVVGGGVVLVWVLEDGFAKGGGGDPVWGGGGGLFRLVVEFERGETEVKGDGGVGV